MLFLFDKIVKTSYGQEEIDIGIETADNSDTDSDKGSELTIVEETPDSISSPTEPMNTITGFSS